MFLLIDLIGKIYADQVSVKGVKVEFFNKSGDIVKLISDDVKSQTDKDITFAKVKMRMQQKKSDKTFLAETDNGYYDLVKKMLTFWGHISFESKNEFKLFADKVNFYTETKDASAQGHVQLKRENMIFRAKQVYYNDHDQTFEFPKGVEIQIS